MLSTIVWVGLIVFLVGAFSLVTGIFGLSKAVVITAMGAATWAGGVCWFGYVKDLTRPLAQADPADQRPTALVLAFEDDTPPALRREGTLKPGRANEDLAAWLTANARRFDLILTQETIIVALFSASVEDGTYIKGTRTRVYRMHRHDGNINVRTLESLSCALQRLRTAEQHSERPVVLIAHDKQYERARRDLEWLHPRIVDMAVPKITRYKTDGVLEPFFWARRELFFARPIEFMQRHFLMPAGGCCRTTISLDPVPSEPEGRGRGRPSRAAKPRAERT